MNIEEAKMELEKQIIFLDGVIGVGVVNENNTPVIEVAVDKKDGAITEKLKKILINDQWRGYAVKVVPADGFKFH